MTYRDALRCELATKQGSIDYGMLGRIFREHFNLTRKRVRDGKTLYWVYVSAD